MQFVDNAGPDQPAHLRRLIWAFAVRLQVNDTVIYVHEQRPDCTDEHALLDLTLRFFSHVSHHLIYYYNRPKRFRSYPNYMYTLNFFPILVLLLEHIHFITS